MEYKFLPFLHEIKGSNSRVMSTNIKKYLNRKYDEHLLDPKCQNGLTKTDY